MFKDGINEIKIETYDELVNIIRGKDEKNNVDLRENFVFRGLSNVKYELIPSSFRKNKLNQMEIDELIEDDYEFYITIDKADVEKYHLNYYEHELLFESNITIIVDKYGKPTLNKNSEYIAPKNKLQREKEYYILQKFFRCADKCGLKVNTNELTRELIHPSLSGPLDNWEFEYNFSEIMSLAQHYGLPTKALDWSYDYKVSLYFAVRDILFKSDISDGVLWAINYKLFENQKFDDYMINLQFHRPEYNTNPNLTAQKGLFTFLDYYVDDYECPLDEIISSELKLDIKDRFKGDYHDTKIVTIPPQLSSKDTIFYKFIIPKEVKCEILKELYLEGYSEEYLFPGYNGVSESIINRIKLNNLSKNSDKISKKNILLSVADDRDLKTYEFIKSDFKNKIDKIFIYSNNKIIGYFRGNEINKDVPENLWEKFGDKSNLSKDEFDNYFKDFGFGFAIRINDLNIFEYPITLCNFELHDEFCFVEDFENLKFLLNFE